MPPKGGEGAQLLPCPPPPATSLAQLHLSWGTRLASNTPDTSQGARTSHERHWGCFIFPIQQKLCLSCWEAWSRHWRQRVCSRFTLFFLKLRDRRWAVSHPAFGTFLHFKMQSYPLPPPHKHIQAREHPIQLLLHSQDSSTTSPVMVGLCFGSDFHKTQVAPLKKKNKAEITHWDRRAEVQHLSYSSREDHGSLRNQTTTTY